MEAKTNAPATAGIGGMDNVVPVTPAYFTYIRYAQIVMTFVVFICSCVAVSQSWVAWGGGFGIFTAIWTAFFLAAVMLIPIYATNFYYKWAALVAEAFCVLWWLVTFAGLAVWASWLSVYNGAYDDFFGLGGNYYKGAKTAYGATAAGAAFGAFNWISFCVTFVLFGIACNRSRKAKAQYGGEAGTTSMGPIGQPAAQPAYDPNQQQQYQQYPTVPTPAPQQPYQQTYQQ